MLTDLSQNDFAHLTNYATQMRSTHDREFMETISPDLIRSFYRGSKFKDSRFSRMGYGSDNDHLLMLSMIFGSANTILPNIHHRNSTPIITALRGQPSVPNVAPEESAAILTALERYYLKKNDGKQNNQEAALNAYWFGLGWKKLGYSRVSEPSPEIAGEPETQVPPTQSKQDGFNFLNMLGMGEKKQPDALQSKERMEFVEEEGIFNSSESPLNVMLDHKADLRNGKAVLHRLPRTLYELLNFPGYDQGIMTEVEKKFKHSRGSRLDSREVDLMLNELHVRQRNGIWILSWIDTFEKPLQYEKSTWQGKGFQLVPLTFSNEPGVRYPISHMKIAVQVQDRIDKLASLFYETVARSRNMLFVYKEDLEKGTLEAIEQNKIQGIAVTKNPISSGTFAHAQSPSVTNDLPTLIALAQQNLTEVMGSDAQMTTGKSKNKTLGQDELARMGTQVRESGMQDRFRDFMIEQFEKEASLLQEYCDAELKLEILGTDFADPIMAEKFHKVSVEFMSQSNPIAARRYIEGVEYEFDFNVEDSIKPDREKIMANIERVIAFTTNPIVEQAINESGFMVNTGKMSIEWMKQVESLGNPKKYLTPIDSMQLAAMQTKRMLMQGGGSMARPPAPQQKSGGRSVGKTSSESTEPKSSEMAGATA